MILKLRNALMCLAILLVYFSYFPERLEIVGYADVTFEVQIQRSL